MEKKVKPSLINIKSKLRPPRNELLLQSVTFFRNFKKKMLCIWVGFGPIAVC